MPLARVGATIVLFSNVMLESSAGYDQMARLSSPVPRRKLFFTVQLLALPLKLMPSAWVDSMTLFSTVRFLAFPFKLISSRSVDFMTLFSTVQLLFPYWSHSPTLVSWIHSPLI